MSLHINQVFFARLHYSLATVPYKVSDAIIGLHTLASARERTHTHTHTHIRQELAEVGYWQML